MLACFPHPPRCVLALCLILPLASCSTPRRGPAVPDASEDKAVALGNPVFRTWGDGLSAEFLDELITATDRELDALGGAYAGDIPPAHFLAISGGGANGAYGAGLLCGWTAAGTRPEFKVVTGISTGALTAPFAYLGPAYDAQLEEVYTTLRTKDIVTERGPIAAVLFNDAMADSKPLRKLLVKYITADLLEAIAREYDGGRVLLILTTNLDSSRPMIWNIGAIAASGHPDALQTVRDILLASASIPGAFPPVLLDVEADGRKYQEMHVDGGASAQLFLYPPSLQLRDLAVREGIVRERHVYIIRNARVDPKWAAVQRKTLSIAIRAIDSLIQTQGMGDLYRVYATSVRDGVDFNLAFIPPEFKNQPAEAFDPVFMRQLFDLGAAAARGGYAWSKYPPGFEAMPEPESEPEPAPSP
jgi:hypothetical protein